MMGVEQQKLPSNLDSIGMVSDNIIANLGSFLVILAVFVILILVLFALLCI